MQIEIEPSPTAETLQTIYDGLRRHNHAFAPAGGDSSFAVFLRDVDGRILGGLIAKAGRGWLKIGTLWVDETVRGRGFGRQLMETAEAEGVQRGCHSAYLDTFSFQAPEFYQKLGYEILGTLEAFPDPHKRFFMRKSLQPDMRSEIVLIGPPFAGKSTIGKLLAQKLGVPQVSLDKLRWNYYREIGFDDVLAQELRQKGGFIAVVAYWSLFNSHAIERILAEHTNCVFDFGAGPIVFENDKMKAQIQKALQPFKNVLRLLPSPTLDKSIEVLQERSQALHGTNVQGFNWSKFFVLHEENRGLAKIEVYTDGKTPSETCAEIIALIQDNGGSR